MDKIKIRRKKSEIEQEMTMMQKLSAPFPEKYIKRRSIVQDGKESVFEYVPGDKVIERLNQCFNGAWHFCVVDKIIDTSSGQVAILGELRIAVLSSTIDITKQQWGGATIKTFSNGKIICLADDIKAATTDALKKCATMLGVGLYLYDSSNEVRDISQNAPTPVVKEVKEKTEELRGLSEEKCTKAQISSILKISRENNIGKELILSKYGKAEFSDMLKTEAAEFIMNWRSLFKQPDSNSDTEESNSDSGSGS